jgi:alpha-glucosidase (family GH31 glycosyl hydrolase)
MQPGLADGDWVGRTRSPGDNYGNQMTGFDGAKAGNAQFPVLFAVGDANLNYAMFLDHGYKQTWNLSGDPWLVETPGDQIRGYVMTGPNLPDLRQDYMALVGRPPVPPKQAFGLWVSEYGFDDWNELEGKLSSLRSNHFPIDGFVLDLQWFGGIKSGQDDSKMGRLTWDPQKFPNAAQKLQHYKNDEGIGIIAIEESYISKALPEHADLQGRGYLVRTRENGPPVYLTGNPWWGKGGMIDWTQDAAGDYWHDTKRRQLISDGLLGHWTDLGEPESGEYDANDWTAGVVPDKHGHLDYHNLYALKWVESIARGYARNGTARRPFILSRSGTAGIQRFGAAMWSGDVAAKLSTLAAHLNAQMHMSMSGMDYFGSDIGGFIRDQTDGETNDVYTRWLANSLWFDVPVRPHTENLCNCKETAPDRIGNREANLANLRQRYELIPYYYSLAHRANQFGEPVVPPLVYYYQNDPTVRTIGGEKLIGRDLLVVAATAPGIATRDVYLPAGDWINYHTGEWVHSEGRTFPNQDLMQNGLFRLPVYARKGAIIPKMFVDDKTVNALGRRLDLTKRDELIVRAYHSNEPTSFLLYEDDNETIGYLTGQLRQTRLSQLGTTTTAKVVIDASSGTFTGASNDRVNVVELYTNSQQAREVKLNGATLPEQAGRAAFEAAASGWWNAGNGLVLAKSESIAVATAKTFEFSLQNATKPAVNFICNNAATGPGEGVYVVGNSSMLGNWKADAGVRLEQSQPASRWARVLDALPVNTTVEWKCVIRRDSGKTNEVLLWEPGENNVLVTPANATVDAEGDFQSSSLSSVYADFVCDAGVTVPGQSVYVVGNVARLGSWQAPNAVKLDPIGTYPRWTGRIYNLPPSKRIEWKCIKRNETGDTNTVLLWEPGNNNQLKTPATGSAGTAQGSFSAP